MTNEAAPLEMWLWHGALLSFRLRAKFSANSSYAKVMRVAMTDRHRHD